VHIKSLSSLPAPRLHICYILPGLPSCRANHGNIFGNSVGLELRKYRYFNSSTRGLDYQVRWGECSIIMLITDMPAARLAAITRVCASAYAGVSFDYNGVAGTTLCCSSL
jgi:hypothetical protein